MHEKIREYLEWKGTYASRASVNYKIWLTRFVEICGNKPIEEYAVTDLVRYHKVLEARFNPCTVQFAMIVIKNFFRFFKHQDYKCLSPSLIRIPRINAKSHRAITPEEFNKILRVIPSYGFQHIRDLLIIRMLWDTGVRVSELCDLEITQVDENKTSAVISTKKTGKKRVIVWSDETHKVLMKYMSLRMELHALNRSGALFVGRQKSPGIRLTSRSVERRIKYYVKMAGIKEKITPHSFRHGWAHKRRDHNAPLAFIQRGLGHANPVSTFIYEQYNDNDFTNRAKGYLAR